MRGRLLALLVAVTACAAVAVLWSSALTRPAPSTAERAQALAGELRCPVCGAESVADSSSDVAATMRTEISEQLAVGRSPDEVRAWFAQRYGQDVLLRPAASGTGLLVWLLPVGALAVGAVALLRRVRGPERRAVPRRAAAALAAVAVVGAVTVPALLPAGSGSSPADEPHGDEPALAALAQEAARGDDPGSWTALGRALADRGRHADAVAAYRSALAARDDHGVRLLLGLSLVRSDRPAEAVPLLRQVLDARPEEPEALLVLAAALRDDDPAEARAVLDRFLAVAPDHPAAPGVREAVEEQGR